MKLYHGTSIAGLRKILDEGIKPRHPKGKGNWEKFPSKEGYVYLTNAYALYFALQSMAVGDTKYAIVEVDTKYLDESKLCPDEDFIGQQLALQKKATMADATHGCNPIDYQHHWLDSLNGLGNCSYYGKVPAHAITRVAIVSTEGHENAVMLTMLAMDPAISLLNYRLLGEKYRSLIGYVFDGTDVYDPMGNVEQPSMENVPEKEREMFERIIELPKKQREMMRELRPHVVQVLTDEQARRMYPKDVALK